jgi:hypothetical protein
MGLPESRNCPTFFNACQVGFQENIWSGGLWDMFTWKGPLNWAVLWINIAENLKCRATLSENHSYRILRSV